MAAPHPQPLALRALHGNTTHERIPVDPIDGVGDLGMPPEWFDKTQTEQWASVIERAPRGVLSETDRESVIAFVVAFVEFRRASVDVRENGQVFINEKNGKAYQNPAFALMVASQKIMATMGSLIGFNPSARAHLTHAGVGTGNARNMPGQIHQGSRLAAYLASKPDKLD